MFATFGILEEVMSDGGLQFSSFAFQSFAKHYEFQHTISSPRYTSSRPNGEAERAVQTVKNLLKKLHDPYLALLAYRTSPLRFGYNPAELLIDRPLRSRVSILRLPEDLFFYLENTLILGEK